jgi:hypothetical protein
MIVGEATTHEVIHLGKQVGGVKDGYDFLIDLCTYEPSDNHQRLFGTGRFESLNSRLEGATAAIKCAHSLPEVKYLPSPADVQIDSRNGPACVASRHNRQRPSFMTVPIVFLGINLASKQCDIPQQRTRLFPSLVLRSGYLCNRASDLRKQPGVALLHASTFLGLIRYGLRERELEPFDWSSASRRRMNEPRRPDGPLTAPCRHGGECRSELPKVVPYHNCRVLQIRIAHEDSSVCTGSGEGMHDVRPDPDAKLT